MAAAAAKCTKRCGEGGRDVVVKPTQWQTACSVCYRVNKEHQEPQLRCSGCARNIKNKEDYFAEIEQRTEIKLCNECNRLVKRGGKPEYLAEHELSDLKFVKKPWLPKEEVDADGYVQCEERLRPVVPLPVLRLPGARAARRRVGARDGTVGGTGEVLLPVVPAARPGGVGALAGYQRLLALRADALPRCALSDTIEEHLAAELQANHVTAEGLVVRVVAAKWAEYKAVSGMKERYDGTDRAYPDGFPYTSQALLAFQQVGGRDVCLFGMYVQEYGEDCPAPNTNRVYISYVDSVRYLESTGGERGGRTPLYHAIINGYLKHAADRGFGHAHLWVAPPGRASSTSSTAGRRTSATATSRCRCRAAHGTGDAQPRATRRRRAVHRHLRARRAPHLGARLPRRGRLLPRPPARLSQPGAQAVAGRTRGCAGGGEPPPPLKRDSSNLVIEGMKKQSKSFRKRFLGALNAPADGAAAQETEEELSACSTRDAIGHCQTSHWQFDDLERAHYTTMMVLAMLLKAPAASSPARWPRHAAQPAIEELS